MKRIELRRLSESRAGKELRLTGQRIYEVMVSGLIW